VVQNYAEAAKWYLKAARQGVPFAQYAIGNIYASGRGVSRNLIEAYAWLTIASFNGVGDAEKSLSAIGRLMPRDELMQGANRSKILFKEIEEK
jgi:TPR repeat protein